MTSSSPTKPDTEPVYTEHQLRLAATFGITVPQLSRWLANAWVAALAELEAELVATQKEAAA